MEQKRYLFRLTFSRIISIFVILLSQCLVAKRIEKKPHITQTIVCQLIVSLLQTNSVFSRFLLLSSFNPNYHWIQSEVVHFQNIPAKPLSGESLGSKIFFPSVAVRDKNPLWAWAMIFVISAHARPDVRKFLTSGNGCFQSPTFPDLVTKKRRALGTRMWQGHYLTHAHSRTLTAEVGAKQSIKRQLCTTHVGDFG